MLKKGLLITLILGILLLCGCGVNPQNAPVVTTEIIAEETGTEKNKGSELDEVSITSEVTVDAEFGGAIFDITPEEFNDAGFNLGDSCNVVFSNGVSFDDVPYYNGYYARFGFPVIVAYPGNDNILINLNYGSISSQYGIKDGDTVVVTLKEPGKYAAIHDTLGNSYSNDINEYSSKKDFCNFRAMTGGNIKENYFFRGASPVDNKMKRAAHVDSLLSDNQIHYILDLADSDEEIREHFESKDFNSPYAAKLYSEGKIGLLNLNAAYRSDEFKQGLITGLTQMIGKEGPVYIHCLEGKDRTGFVCVLLEALAGASYDEMEKDYMLTYENYYSVTKNGQPEKYQAISSLFFFEFMEYLYGSSDKEVLRNADYTEGAKDYLRSGGMSEENIQKLLDYISK